jgi:threonine dehydrogenase-like Zn-dependent dehydrogenase
MKAVLLEGDWDPRRGYHPTEQELKSGKATVASAVWRNPRFSPVELADPVPGHGEVLLRVRTCGVCGSDTHCYERDDDGYVLFSGPVRLPVVAGHEYTAEVVEVGPGVRSLHPGQLVTGEGMLYCGICDACRIGRANQCQNLDMLGFSAQGAYAEYLVADERLLWPLDGLVETLGDEQRALGWGSLVEPIGCSYNGMFVAGGGLTPGAHVAVFGCGPIGLGAVALARVAGAATVLAFETVAERREVALRMGADAVWDPREVSAADVIRERTGGWGADMMVEAAGAGLHTMPEIERAFAPGSVMVYLGRTGLRVPMMLDVMVTQAARIVGSRGHVGQGIYPRIIRLMESGRLTPDAMITTRLPFERTIDALGLSTKRTDAKILVTYD